MEKEQLRKQYEAYSSKYVELQKEVVELVSDILNGSSPELHIADIRQRPNDEIKAWKSIEANLENPRKYKELKSLFDIKDIAGVRVICHCEDDLEAVATMLEGNLKQRYASVEKENKGGSNNTGKSNPSYRAIHLTFSKTIKNQDDEVSNLFCEIQMRTVMADAWAVQDRQYIYGKAIEGEANYLTDAVADIMNGCDRLWSLVKKKSLEYDGLEMPKEILSLKKDTETKVNTLIKASKSPLSISSTYYWFEKKHDQAIEGLEKLSREGYMEIRAQILDQAIEVKLNKIKEAARDSTIDTFGWPIAVFIEERDEFRPRPDGDSIKAELSIQRDSSSDLGGRSTYDYWTIRKDGAFYLLASLFEDERAFKALFFDTRIIRITETLMYLRGLYDALGVEPKTKLQIEITHGGLRGRILTAASQRRSLSWPRKCGTDLVKTRIETDLDELNNNISDLVESFTEELFEQFDLFELSRSVLDDLVLNYVEGRIV